MSSNTHEARELLRLFKCVVDTGTDVLAAFAKVKLLPTFNGNFKQFLDDKKHEILHLWQSQKLLCCECPPAGCNVTRKRCMDNWIFKTFYDDSGPENTGHIVRNSRDIVQVCLHKYITRNIAIEELDISTITFLLRNLAILSLNETTSLNIITKTRNQICHAYSMNCYTMASMNTAWSDLENALVDLTDPPYKRILRKQVKFLRKAELEKEEITELKNNVDRVLLEVKNSSDNNVGYLVGMENRLENKSINNTEDIKQHTTEETSYFAAQAQQALSEKIQNTGDIVQKEIGTKLHEHWSKMQEVEEKKQVMFMEMYRKINNIELSVKCERPVNLFVPEKACTDTTECPVLWHMEIPKDWNPEAIIVTLRDQSNKLFKIKFVRKGSLIMLTTISASILSDSELFEAAVMSFLTKMIEDCDINTEIPGRVEVKLHILNANEVSISCELPPEGQNKHVSHSSSQTSPYECSNCFKKDEQLSLFEQRQHNQERGTLGLEQTISDVLDARPIPKLGSRTSIRTEPPMSVAITKNEFESKYYKIKSGLVLVLNNKEFHVPGECLGDRAGSDIDASSIAQRFSELGFEYELKTDLSKSATVEWFEKVKRQLITKPVDCFVLVILSHGTENGVYATDRLMKTVDIVECFNATNCRQLRLKPKVVIIQSSRDRIRSNVNLIDRNTPDCPADLSDYNDWLGIPSIFLPNEADFLFAYATVQGPDAFTNAAEVTPFIRHLSKAIEKMEENEDFCSVLTTVNKTVGMTYKTNTGEAKLNNEVQMPCFVSHLTKSLRLSPLRFDG